MKQMDILPSYVYKWNSKFFWGLIILNIIGGALCTYYKSYTPLRVLIGLGLFSVSLYYWVSTSLFPSSNSSSDGMSFKYIRSLPISKGELLFNYGLLSILFSAPLLTFFLSFFECLTYFSNPVRAGSKFFFIAIPLLFIFGLESFRMKLFYPSGGHFEGIARKKLYLYNFKIFSLIITALFITFTTTIFLESIFNINTSPYFENLKELLRTFIFSWFFPATLTFIALIDYFQVLKQWESQNPYKTFSWKSKRDIPLISLSIIFNIAFILYTFQMVPSYYDDNPLLVSIFREDHAAIKEHISEKQDLNFVNKYGFTPLMAAAYTGSWKSYQLLKEAGAHKWDKVKYSNDETIDGANLLHLALLGGSWKIIQEALSVGIDPNEGYGKAPQYPIHMAANKCWAKTLDLLIEKGAKVDLQNKDGENALHLASKRYCFPTIALLMDHGLDPYEKDKNGKWALLYMNKYDRMTYYIKKRSRRPAGKKK